MLEMGSFGLFFKPSYMRQWKSQVAHITGNAYIYSHFYMLHLITNIFTHCAFICPLPLSHLQPGTCLETAVSNGKKQEFQDKLLRMGSIIHPAYSYDLEQSFSHHKILPDGNATEFMDFCLYYLEFHNQLRGMKFCES